MTNEEKKQNLIKCRRAYVDRGAKLVEITHLDGSKSGIANPSAIKAVMDALKAAAAEKIELCLNSASSPCIVRAADGGDKFTYMILPVRLRAGD